MQIKDLQPKQGNVDLEAQVKEVGEVRTFDKFGKQGRVANAVLSDETGEVKLTLWNEQVDQVKAGDRVKISKGYVNEWQGEKQLTTGKFGSLEVLGDAPAAPAEEPAAEEPAPEAPAEPEDLSVEEENL